MKDSEKIRILDDVILNLEINQERAAVMADSIDQGYFDLTDDQHKLYYFGKTGIKFDILQDYIIWMGDQLNEARKMLREWRKEKETDQQVIATSQENREGEC